jgi:hypothetical protein
MISLKGVLLGLGLSLTGTVVYVAWLIWETWQRFPKTLPGEGVVGIDLRTIVANMVIPNSRYWIFALVLMALGFSIVYLFQKSIPV